mgnify:CR=1 FL=1|tara:strand:- start:19 stop:195 length:177 start_codon:yes stop_codon:yes gene_type:complete
MEPIRDLAVELQRSRDVKAIEFDRKYTSQHNDKSMKEIQNWVKDKSRSKSVMCVAYVK